MAIKQKRSYTDLIVENVNRNEQIAEFVVDKLEGGEWPAIVFVQEVRHGELLSTYLEELRGEAVLLITAQNTTEKQRAEYARRMRVKDPSIPVVVATEVWGTGVDIPCLAAGFNAGARQAPIGLRQRTGRLLRVDGTTTFKWYDFIDNTTEGNYLEHGCKRVEHYTRAGLDLSDQSKLLMQKILEKPRQEASPVPYRRPGNEGCETESAPELPEEVKAFGRLLLAITMAALVIYAICTQ